MGRRAVPLTAAAVAAFAAGACWLRRVVLPPRPDKAPTAQPHLVRDPEQRPSPDGAGVTIAVNPGSGPAWTQDPTDELRAGLPQARIHRLGEDDDLAEILADGDPQVIGAAGGDGTLSAAAAVAVERDLVLVAVPTGTFNHLARDLGLEEPADAIAAVRAGTATRIDLGVVELAGGSRTFVNTLSFGGYTQIVDARERMEPRLGKWLALVVALATQLPRMQSLHLEVDGRPTVAWLGWIGNCAYAPDGFGPSWRERLDDGQLDVRLVLGGRKGARLRLLLDVLTGRLRHCPFYRELKVRELDVRSPEGPLRLAVDGETIDGGTHFTISKRPRALLVAIP
ncbi:MAG: diacylglycerol/lipid kinase family protein [Ilumatobacteraceae bacterium]